MIVPKILVDNSYQPDLSELDLNKFLLIGYSITNDGLSYNLDLERKLDDFEKITIALIRKRYSIDDEVSLARQKEIKPEEYQEYFDYAESCKMEARISNPKQRI